MAAALRTALIWSLECLLGILVTFLACLAFMQVVLRYVFSSAILWVEEISVMALIWLAWLGVVYLWLTRAHIAVDLVSEALSQVAARRLAHAIDVLAIVLGGGLVVVSVGTLRIYSGMEMGSLEMNASWKYLPVPVGGAGLALAACLNLWQRLADPGTRQ